MVNFCNPGVLGSLPQFRNTYQTPIEKGRDASATKAAAALEGERSRALTALLSRFVLRRTAEVNDAFLPPKSEAIVFVRLAPLQVALYRAIVASKAVRDALGSGGGSGSSATILVVINMLRLVCAHADLVHPAAVTKRREVASGTPAAAAPKGMYKLGGGGSGGAAHLGVAKRKRPAAPPSAANTGGGGREGEEEASAFDDDGDDDAAGPRSSVINVESDEEEGDGEGPTSSPSPPPAEAEDAEGDDDDELLPEVRWSVADTIAANLAHLFPPGYAPSTENGTLALGGGGRTPSADLDVALASSGKMHLLDALLTGVRATAPTDRVVIVSNFATVLNLVESVARGRGYTFLRLDGGTPTDKRPGLVAQFNAGGGPFLFLLSALAGGVGLNLVGANRLVLLDASWNPAVDRWGKSASAVDAGGDKLMCVG